MKKLVLTICLLAGMVLVQGCVAPPTIQQMQTAHYGEYPENYEKIIKDYMEISLVDSESAKYKFAEQTPCKGYMMVWNTQGTQARNEFGYVVYFSVNAKNRMGGYVGYTPFESLIRDGILIGCSEIVFKPDSACYENE